MEHEIVANAKDPWDPLVSACLEKFGKVESVSNLILTPSLLLGGQEDAENMMKMDGFTAMVWSSLPNNPRRPPG